MLNRLGSVTVTLGTKEGTIKEILDNLYFKGDEIKDVASDVPYEIFMKKMLLGGKPTEIKECDSLHNLELNGEVKGIIILNAEYLTENQITEMDILAQKGHNFLAYIKASAMQMIETKSKMMDLVLMADVYKVIDQKCHVEGCKHKAKFEYQEDDGSNIINLCNRHHSFVKGLKDVAEELREVANIME